jgi:hypothetical protein
LQDIGSSTEKIEKQITYKKNQDVEKSFFTAHINSGPCFEFMQLKDERDETGVLYRNSRSSGGYRQ